MDFAQHDSGAYCNQLTLAHSLVKGMIDCNQTLSSVITNHGYTSSAALYAHLELMLLDIFGSAFPFSSLHKVITETTIQCLSASTGVAMQEARMLLQDVGRTHHRLGVRILSANWAVGKE